MNGINTTVLTGFAAAITPIRRPANPVRRERRQRYE